MKAMTVGPPGTLSQFPAMYKGKLINEPDAGSMSSTTTTLSIEPSNGLYMADVEIVVPVYNEQQDLAVSIARLHSYLSHNFPLSWLITVADNASTDSTWAIACRLARELDRVRALHLAQKGRGRALRTAWLQSNASVVAYMDVDLSTDLDALLPLVAPLITGHSDVAIGSRLARGARVVRGPKREFISRSYNLILRATLHNSFSDAQCGFKAMRAEPARRLLPLVEDNAWFFDTELLVLAERSGLRLHEVAVDWVDDPRSTVDIVRTARDDLKGIARMMRPDPNPKRGTARLPLNPTRASGSAPNASGELVHLAGRSLLSTFGFAVLFIMFYGSLGGVGADVLALALCALALFVAGPGPSSVRPGSVPVAPYWRRPYGARRLLWASLPLVCTLGALAAISAAGVGSLPVDGVVLTASVLGAAVARFYHLRRSLTRAG
jgi:Glycosyl transferase family 2